jgi:hypothetical protein
VILNHKTKNPHIGLASFDISNMYTNIPTLEVQHIIADILNHNVSDPLEKQEYLQIYETLINQNYFTHNGKFYKQKEGLAMGAPSSAFLSEVYLQYIEFNNIVDTVTKHNIQGYFRYVDDILIVCNSLHTDIQLILNEFNKIQPQLQFTIECEVNNTRNTLDLTIYRQNANFEFSIFRKPTYTDTIIPYNSCHPKEHTYAAVRYLVNRWNNYSLTTEAKNQELIQIQNILHNNSFPLQLIQTMQPTGQKKQNTEDNPKPKQKWATFTYFDNETRRITKIFKHINIHIAFKTKSNIQHLLQPKNLDKSHTDKFGRSGVY